MKRISSQQTTLSTNHVRAFRPFEGSETGFKVAVNTFDPKIRF